MEKVYSKGEIEAKNIDKAKDSALRDVKNEKLSVDEIYEKAKKASESGSNSIRDLTRDEARGFVKGLLNDNGEINLESLQAIIPDDVPNTFVPTDTIKDGGKYEFTLADGQKAIIRWHEPDPVAAEKYPGCASGSRKCFRRICE
ncbi:Hypothetical protein CM240_0226 [Clostridium bornimense]|uniref:Uncharacterized protein n=1 Tax=Clostridium bornimense TaxID=1216932 RepID=W6RS62_9CLOT|nr:hypothetical protein [Clostridium bornimense]CDM67396.1 Hypothetical protein CM240_0226 [Clostridium bornimense]